MPTAPSIGTHLPTPAPAAAELPLLLLPVRLETRFGGTRASPELRVRIYPDQIAIDSHEPELTGAEVSAGRAYWERLWRAGSADEAAERAEWASLARALGPERAAYVARAPGIQPDNLGARPPAPTPAGSDPSPAPEFAPIPPERMRAASWTRAPLARCLPEAWTVVLERDGSVVAAKRGRPIRVPLAAGPDPAAPAAPDPDGLAVDEPMRWLVDFDAAVVAGMAVSIPIATADLDAGFERVLVYGVRASSDADRGSGRIAALLEAHRFTDGLALVPQGAATNNTPDATAAFTARDADYVRSFATERRGPLPQRDGAVLAEALGLAAGALEHVEHSDRGGQDAALAMAVALWPATFGYFLRQLMPEVVDEDGEEAARGWFLTRVRPRGPLPAIRIGQTPYGILPTTSLSLYAPRRRHPLGSRLAGLLRRLLPAWRRSLAGSPRVTREGDPDEELVRILGMDASARAYRVRRAVGEEFLGNVINWLEIDSKEELLDLQFGAGRELLDGLGLDTWDPRVIRLALMDRSHAFPFAIVADEPVSETAGLPPVPLPDGGTGNYISWLRQAPIADIRDDVRRFPGGTAPTALLYRLLRQAVLLEYGSQAFGILRDAELVDRGFVEYELLGFRERDGDRPTVWQALARPLPGDETGALTIGAYLQDVVVEDGGPHRRLGELRAALDDLARLPTAELERLVTETLDTFSHRIDPWLTSLATDLLAARPGDAAELHVGGYGWVEDLRADPLPPVVEGGERARVRRLDAAREQRAPEARRPADARAPRVDNGGFIHAPSLGQAAAAAVLRNGYLTHGGADRETLSIDLSSRGVQTALELLDGVRQGQPLGALLGYRFERSLHAARLDAFVDPFRRRFPVVANRLTQPSGPVEAVAASNVVDGRALHAAWQDGSLTFTGELAATDAQQALIEGFLRELDDALDALGDVSLAESVYQIMRGNHGRAGGLLDAVSRGEHPPDPDVVRTPRSGVDLTHRLVLLFPGAPARAAGWPGAAHPRAVAEPWLDAWLSHRLPFPDSVRCRVAYRDGGSEREQEIRLSALRLSPLDALDLAVAADRLEGSELEQHVAYRALRTISGTAEDVRILFARAPGWSLSVRSFPEFLAATAELRDLLGGARPLEPRDLIEPDRTAAAHGGALDLVELATRAAGAVAGLGGVVAALGGSGTAHQLRLPLLAASRYGARGAVPVRAAGGGAEVVAALREQAAAVRVELAKRHKAATDADAGFDRTDAAAESLRDHLLGLLRHVFGAGFVACPRFTPPDGPGLAVVLGATSALLGGDEDAPARWLAQLVPVRPGVARWDMARTVSALIGRSAIGEPVIGQLPQRAGDRWLGLPFDGAPPPPAGRVALMVWLTADYDETKPHSGLLLDEWPERIPSTSETTGVSFHFNQPTARAPQALLLAACPDERSSWDDEVLVAVLRETLEAAKLRTVDLDSLRELGQVLPGIYVPFNPRGDAVSFRAVRIG